jgi:hypothetical protein
MTKIRHSRLPITLESSDRLTKDFLEAIEFNISLGWNLWVDDSGNWFHPLNNNPNQLELFENKMKGNK